MATYKEIHAGAREVIRKLTEKVGDLVMVELIDVKPTDESQEEHFPRSSPAYILGIIKEGAYLDPPLDENLLSSSDPVSPFHRCLSNSQRNLVIPTTKHAYHPPFGWGDPRVVEKNIVIPILDPGEGEKISIFIGDKEISGYFQQRDKMFIYLELFKILQLSQSQLPESLRRYKKKVGARR